MFYLFLFWISNHKKFNDICLENSMQTDSWLTNMTAWREEQFHGLLKRHTVVHCSDLEPILLTWFIFNFNMNK